MTRNPDLILRTYKGEDVVNLNDLTTQNLSDDEFEDFKKRYEKLKNKKEINAINIPSYLARYCYSLINIVLPTAVSGFEQYAFQYCRLLKYVIIPTVSNYTVGAYAFQYCYSLHTIILNSSIWYLSTASLGYCSAFTELVFNYLKNMQGSYNQMSALKVIDFSTNTSEIGSFQDCVSLTKVICRTTTVPILGSSAFTTQVSNATFKIYVPDASVATYKAASGWSTYANYIYPLSSL